MKPNIALQTFSLLAAWLVFENFNLSTAYPIPYSVLDRTCGQHGSLKPAFGCWDLDAVCAGGCKSMESKVYSVPSLEDLAPFLNPSPPYRIKTIVLDAGHGGKDPGCIGASAYEKDNTLAIVLRLGAYLEANYPEIRVVYTRNTDVFVELNERAAIANRNAADLFISVHCNAAVKSKTVQGAETYVLGLHRSKDNLEVAKRENASIYLEENYKKNYAGYDPESPEAEIFASVWQSAYLEQSILLASYVQQFANAVAFREDRGVKQAGFLVLRETAMPSVLIEAGYLTNASEDEFLASEAGREQTALAIFQAFEAYKRHVETGKSSANVAATTPPKKPAVSQPEPARPTASTTNVPPANSGGTTATGKTVAQQSPLKTSGGSTAANQPNTNKPVTGAKSPAANTGRYTIFLLSWPNKLDPDVGQLSLLANVKETKVDGKYHYYSGDYATKADAETVLPEILNMGFKTAAIVQN